VEYGYFKRFLADHSHLEAYRTEWCVFYEELKLSGSIDMVFRDKTTGEFYIYDWKRVKEIEYEGFKGQCAITQCIHYIPHTNFWHYSLQLNTYKAILESKYDMKISGLFLVCLHPDNPAKSYEVVETHDLTAEMADLFEYRRSQLAGNAETLEKGGLAH
jgi:hypothetical protein